jgi:hypothetical protein
VLSGSSLFETGFSVGYDNYFSDVLAKELDACTNFESRFGKLPKIQLVIGIAW